MKTEQALQQRIEQSVNDSVVEIRPFANGNNTQLYLVDIRDGRRFVAKVADKDDASLDVEGWMLAYLADHSYLPVSDIICAEPKMLITSYLQSSGVIDRKAEINAADLISSLHMVRSGEYGLERDTMIGPLKQINTQGTDWVSFFRDHRLLYMARHALDENRISGDLMADIEVIAGRLDLYIEQPAPPTLLHGDLWSGNVLAVPGAISGFIDPAIYYGDPEIELAFTTLFGTFGSVFFDRYSEHNPIKPGFFEVRKDLYNLYPLLVHTRLFGRSYAQSVKEIVSRLL